MLKVVAIFLCPLLLASASSTASAAPRAPVQWHLKIAPAKVMKSGSKFSVTVSGQVDAGWHLYALEEPGGGPIATQVALAEGDPADLLHVDESRPKVVFDPLFQQPTGFFEGTAEFTLRLQLANDAPEGAHPLHVLVRYQSCNDKVCLPPHTDTIEVPLSIRR
jgi:thiol:disulfide interchange protein DsbD